MTELFQQSPRRRESLGNRARYAGYKALEMLFDPKVLALLAGTGAIVGTIVGINQMMPEWNTAVNYLQATQPDISWFDASTRLFFENSPTIAEAKRYTLHMIGLQSLQTWSDLAAMGITTPAGVSPNDYALSKEFVDAYFTQYVTDGGPGVFEALLTGTTLILAYKIHQERRGPESEFSPEFAQVQKRYDIEDPLIVQKVEELLKGQKGAETYHMEQTYFDPTQCKRVIGNLFGGHDKNQSRNALTAIGLKVSDHILPEEFRLVTKVEKAAIVLRINRGENAFGKETYYVDDGYPPLLTKALSLLAAHVDATTTKERTELKRVVPYSDPTNAKEGTTVAVLNYDTYLNEGRDTTFRRIEIVVPALANVLPEVVFPEFFTPDVLGNLQVSHLNDRQIGHMIKGSEIKGQL